VLLDKRLGDREMADGFEDRRGVHQVVAAAVEQALRAAAGDERADDLREQLGLDH
jgi:hypothetical protein